MVFFTSDMHFGSERILKHRTVFETSNQMDRCLIDNWCSVVNNEDEVYILGDIGGVYTSNIRFYLEALTGRKHLILGNHDAAWMEELSKAEMEKYFVEILPYKEIEEDGKLLVLFHYPLLEWNHSRNSETFLIHGHIHNRMNQSYYYIQKNLHNSFNCCPDINNYRPVTFDDLKKNNDKWYMRT